MGLLSGSGPAAFKSVERTNFIATAGQTTFTLSQGYSVGDIDVFLNGVKIIEGDDYFATNGSTIVLNSAAAVNDAIQVVSYNQFDAANTYTKSEADSKYMVATGQTPMQSYLRTPNYGISSWSDSANASLEASVGAGTQGTAVKVHGRNASTFGGDIHYVSDTRGVGGGHRFYGWTGTLATNLGGISSSGVHARPLQPFVHARPSYSTATTIGPIGTNTPHTIQFGTTITNVGNCYNTATSKFTCPTDGVYYVGGAIQFNATSGTSWNYNLGVYKNSTVMFGVYETFPGSQAYSKAHVAGIFYGAQNDTFSLGLLTNNNPAGTIEYTAPDHRFGFFVYQLG